MLLNNIKIEELLRIKELNNLEENNNESYFEELGVVLESK